MSESIIRISYILLKYFGGSFENRTKALLAIVDGIRERLGDSLAIAVRLNAFDSEPYPEGWGLREENGVLIPDIEEPVRLCRMLSDRGAALIDITSSHPGQRIFGGIGKSAAVPVSSGEEPGQRAPEFPSGQFTEVYDMLMAAREIKAQVSGVSFVCTGLSQFRKFGPAVGAGGIRDGWFDFAGFGRQALAYPEFAGNALSGKLPDDGRCCVICNYCFRLMDPGFSATGCVVRDPEPYASFYRECLENGRMKKG